MEKENTHEQLNSLQEFEFAKTTVIAGNSRMDEFIAIKPVVENLGLSWSGAFERLKRDEAFSQLFVYGKKIAKDGKKYEMVCLKPIDFQNWLYKLNSKSENFNVYLWEEYKKGLVLHLMVMLKISLDEVQRLRNIEQQFTDLKKVTVAYINANDEVRNYSKLAKEKSNEVKNLQQTIIERIEDANTAQLTIFN